MPAEPPVTLEVPFPAHGFLARVAHLDVEKLPLPAPRELGAGAAIVLRQAPFWIEGPPHICLAAIWSDRSDHIDETGGVAGPRDVGIAQSALVLEGVDVGA